MKNPIRYFQEIMSGQSPEDIRFQNVIEGRSVYGPEDDRWYYPVNKTSVTGLNVDEYTALEYSDVYKCVRVIAETIASLPLFVYKRLKNGGKERAEDHDLYDLLHIQPNSEMTAFQFRETGMNHLLTWGNWYSQIEFDGMGNILALWPLRPDRMEVKRGISELIEYTYRPTDGTEARRFSSGEILHIPGLGFNGVTGYSPITMAREAIGLGKAAEEYAGRFFGNDASPGGVLKHPNKLSPQAHDNLKKAWTESFGGVGKSHKPAILEEGMDWAPISIPMKDAQFLELRKFQREEICGIYRVPPHLIGDLSRATFCLPGDQEILTEFGPKEIKDILMGEKVWSLNNRDIVLSKVIKSQCTGEDEILEIKTTNRTIRSNAKHPILTRVKYKNPGLGRGAYQHSDWKTEYVKAGNLKVGDTIVTFDQIRYKKRLQEGKPFGRKARKYPRYGGIEFELPYCELSRIVKITPQPSEPVYDLNVEDSHSFIANGVIVHNSNIEQQSLDFITNCIRPWLVRIEQGMLVKLFSDKERKKYFPEHLIEGMLRGDIQARYGAYMTGKQWGWLNTDEIREKENMNPLPDGLGQAYLVPLNMRELGEEPPQPAPLPPMMNQPIEPEPEEEEEPKKKKSEDIYLSFRRLFEAEIARIIRRETIAIRRALKRTDFDSFINLVDEFYRALPEFMTSNLFPVLKSYAELNNVMDVTDILKQFINDHIQESRGEIEKWIGVYIHEKDFTKNTDAIEEIFEMWLENKPAKASSGFYEYFNRKSEKKQEIIRNNPEIITFQINSFDVIALKNLLSNSTIATWATT